MNAGIFLIVSFVIMISIGGILALIHYIHYRKIYNKNASKISFNLNRKCDIDFEEKYKKLKDKHNKFAKSYIYTWIFIPLFILLIYRTIVLMKVNGLYGAIFFVLMIIVLCVFLTPNSKKGEKSSEEIKYELKKKYFNIILNDMIIDKFNVIHKELNIFSDSDEEVDETEFLPEYDSELNLIENNIETSSKFLRKLFKEMNKKSYKNFDCEFTLECEINNKKVNISRITNYKKDLSGDRVTYIYSFIGYLVKISDFSSFDKLECIDESDYLFDEKNNTLYILISDQIKSSCYTIEENRFSPEFYIKFEKNGVKCLEKNYIYFDELYKFINSLLEV